MTPSASVTPRRRPPRSTRAAAGLLLPIALLLGACSSAPRHRIGSLPFPGPYTIYALADPDELGTHRYEIAFGQALSPSAEAQRGTVYTCRAGFLDVAHLRLTVDWMRHAHRHFRRAAKAGRAEARFEGPDGEMIRAAITYPPVWDEIPDDARTRALDDASIRAAARASYLIWTWHEVITHEGHSTFLLISERGSAFGYDDMASHAVGLAIGEAVLRDDRPHNDAATAHLAAELDAMGVVPKGVCAVAVEKVEGVWWERSGPLARQYDAGLRTGLLPVHTVPGVAGCEGVVAGPLAVPFGPGADPVIQPRFEITIEPRTGAGREIADLLGLERLSAQDIADAIDAIAAEAGDDIQARPAPGGAG